MAAGTGMTDTGTAIIGTDATGNTVGMMAGMVEGAGMETVMGTIMETGIMTIGVIMTIMNITIIMVMSITIMTMDMAM
jgi:hypothetical protein